MRHRGKRRSSRTWFPVEGQEATQEILPANEFWAFTTGTLTCQTGTDGRAADVVGLTWDFPPEVETAADTIPSLADWQGSAWQLGGIVGKFHCGIRQDANQESASLFQTVLVMAWFAVLQVDDEGVPRETDLLKYDPMLASNIRQPYVWRRSWILGRNHIPALNAFPPDVYNAWPTSNALYGSAMDGPHIEAKSGRFIGEDQRLFFGVNAVPLAATGDVFEPEKIDSSILVDYLLDFRLIGTLRKASNRRNTSL